MTPVMEGKLRGESLIDGSVDLAFVADIMDAILCKADNELIRAEREAASRDGRR